MADLIYTSNVSLDGFIEDDRGSFDFTAPDDDVFAFITGLERSAGTSLYGRRMYETMAVWETDPGLGAQSELMADFANIWRRPTRSCTRQRLRKSRPPRLGWNAASTPTRSEP